jgi:hypothetical protein
MSAAVERLSMPVSGTTTTAGVEALFGDLVDEVALAAPVSRSRLVAALAAVTRGADESVAGEASGEPFPVATLDVSEWEDLADRAGLRPATALAVREVHRRMATAIGATDAATTPGADPLVIVDA